MRFFRRQETPKELAKRNLKDAANRYKNQPSEQNFRFLAIAVNQSLQQNLDREEILPILKTIIKNNVEKFNRFKNLTPELGQRQGVNGRLSNVIDDNDQRNNVKTILQEAYEQEGQELSQKIINQAVYDVIGRDVHEIRKGNNITLATSEQRREARFKVLEDKQLELLQALKGTGLQNITHQQVVNAIKSIKPSLVEDVRVVKQDDNGLIYRIVSILPNSEILGNLINHAISYKANGSLENFNNLLLSVNELNQNRQLPNDVIKKVIEASVPGNLRSFRDHINNNHNIPEVFNQAANQVAANRRANAIDNAIRQPWAPACW